MELLFQPGTRGRGEDLGTTTMSEAQLTIRRLPSELSGANLKTVIRHLGEACVNDTLSYQTLRSLNGFASLQHNSINLNFDQHSRIHEPSFADYDHGSRNSTLVLLASFWRSPKELFQL
jgi:hypothetical protein